MDDHLMDERTGRRVRRGLAAAVVAASLVSVVAALTWPAVAETVLRLLLVAVAAGAAAWFLVRVGWPGASDVTASPLRTPSRDAGDRQLPIALRHLADDLSTDARDGGAASFSVLELLRDELRRRLAARGLDMRTPGHADRIRALVSPPAWALLQPPPPAGRQPGQEHPVRVRDLGLILDDVERL